MKQWSRTRYSDNKQHEKNKQHGIIAQLAGITYDAQKMHHAWTVKYEDVTRYHPSKNKVHPELFNPMCQI